MFVGSPAAPIGGKPFKTVFKLFLQAFVSRCHRTEQPIIYIQAPSTPCFPHCNFSLTVRRPGLSSVT